MSCQFLNIVPNSPEWYSYRISQGIGASEISAVMNLDEWTCALKLFHIKTAVLKEDKRSLPLALGKRAEQLVADMYEFFDEDESKFLDNERNDRKVRLLRKVPKVCINQNLPNLFCSLDREYDHEKYGTINVEIKHTTGQVFSRYSESLSPTNTMQIVQQTLITERPSEIVYLVDNRKMHRFFMDVKTAEKLRPTILKVSKDFWNRVIKYRVLATQQYDAKLNYNQKLSDQIQQEMYSLEPVDNSPAYYEYISELSKVRLNSIPMSGTSELLEKAKRLKSISDKKKKLELQEIALKSELASVMRKEGRNEISFGKEGYIQLFGKFTNKVK
jgi:hypothetical protein